MRAENGEVLPMHGYPDMGCNLTWRRVLLTRCTDGPPQSQCRPSVKISRSVSEWFSTRPIMRKLVQEKIAEVERSIEYLEP